MRLATTLAVAAVAILPGILPAAARAQAGTPPITAFGLDCTALGNAQIDYDPVARRMPVRGIGSSGEDGVDIKLGSRMAGVVVSWDSPPDMGPGGAYVFELRGVSGGIGALTTCSVTSHQGQDGSRDLSPDFSSVGATACWVLLLNGNGDVIKRVYKPLPLSVHVAPSGAPVAEMANSAGIGMGKGLYEWIKASYSHEVMVSGAGGGGGGVGTACTDIVFACTTGDPMTGLDGAQVRLNGLPPGEPVIGTLGVVPPCAGCPNGPEETDYLVTRGASRWIVDSTADALAVDNLGASGQDGVAYSPGCPKPICPRESPSWPTLGMVIDEQPLAPATLSCEARGIVAGTTSVLGHLQCYVQPGATEFEPDFSSLGTTGYRVLLYSNGQVVADATNPLSRVSHQKPQTQWLVEAGPSNGTMEYRIICITSPCPGWSVTMNGALYLVDKIVFQSVGAIPGLTTCIDMAITASVSSSGGPGTLTAPYLPVYGVSGSGAPLVGVPVAEAAALPGAKLSPNPASGAVNVVFAMPRGGRADVDVIDAAGRHVRSLAARAFAAGAHALTWDGRDDRGAATAPGVYFVRVESAGTTRSSQVTRLQ
jgi:hypothetical protein